MQQDLDVSNEVAAELAGIDDGVLDSLRDRLNITIRMRGNQLTLEGEEQEVEQARGDVDELVDLVEGGHEIGPSTIDAVVGALDESEDIRDVFEDVVWRHRGKKVAPKTLTQKRYVDAIRGARSRSVGPAGTGKTYLAIALAVHALRSARSDGSSSPARRSRRANGSGSCRVTCSRRSTRTCVRSSTRSTT